MDYIFGPRDNREVLKTKGETHTNLTGYQQVSLKYPDQTITHYFRVVRKIDSKEDVAGNCYDWYLIDEHSRTVDKSGALDTKYGTLTDEITDAICELSITIDKRLGEIEDAACEIAMMVAGGE